MSRGWTKSALGVLFNSGQPVIRICSSWDVSKAVGHSFEMMITSARHTCLPTFPGATKASEEVWWRQAC